MYPPHEQAIQTQPPSKPPSNSPHRLCSSTKAANAPTTPKTNAGSSIATPVWPRSKLDGTGQNAREATYTRIVGAWQRGSGATYGL